MNNKELGCMLNAWYLVYTLCKKRLIGFFNANLAFMDIT